MKIISVQFYNLNSLKGESPLIDFETGTLGSAGIFAITGATGAGKTTILDAICVALYGETPRLKNPGDLMTRHTGECWSEVVFEATGQRYRSRWSLHRSRKKPDGNLQTPKGELVLLGSGDGTQTGATRPKDKIIEERRSNIPKKIEALSGLDFKRFCRSVLLAQGDFDAFLNASVNERAELLEKMTGTEIYGEISRLAYQRFKQEDEMLKTLKAHLNGLEPMTDQELVQQQEALDHAALKSRAFEREIREFQTCHNWYDTMAKHEEFIKNATHELILNAQQSEEAKEELTRLKVHEHAMTFKPELDLIDQYRIDLDRTKSQRIAIEALLPEDQKKVESSEKEFLEINNSLEKFRISKTEEEQKIQSVIRLDEQITGVLRQSSDLRGKKLLSEKRIHEIKIFIEQKNMEHQNSRKCLQIAQTYLHEHKDDNILESKFYWLSEKISNLLSIRNSTVLSQKELANHQNNLKRLNMLVSDTNNQQVMVEKTVAMALEKKEQFKSQLAKLLTQNSLETTDELLARKQGQAHLYEKLTETAIEQETAVAARDKIVQEIALLKENKESITKGVSEWEDRINELEKDLNDLQKRRELELLISKYEDDRKSLIQGQACPLCGSRDHPFIEKDPEIPDQNQTLIRIDEKKKSRTHAIKESEKAHSRLASYQEKLNSLNNLLTQSITQIENALTKWNRAVQEEKKVNNHDLAIDIGQIAELEHQHADIKTEIDSLRKHSGYIRSAQDSIIKSDREFADAEKKLNKILLNLKEIEGKIEAVSQAIKAESLNLNEKQGSIKSSESDLGQILDRLCLKVPSYGNEKEFIINLEARWQKYREHSDKESITKSAIQKLEGELENLARQHHSENENLKTIELELSQKEAELKDQKKIRSELFGDKKPENVKHELDIEEKRYFEAIETTRKTVDQRRQIKSENETRHTMTLESEKSLHERLTNTEKQLYYKVTNYLSGLDKNCEQPFAPLEQDIRSAILQPEKLKNITDLKNSIEKSAIEIRARLSSAQKNLESERTKNLSARFPEVMNSPSPIVKIEERIRELGQLKTEQEQKIGEIRAILKAQEDLKTRQKDKLKQIEAQSREWTRWHTMNELIGSADGMKFRRFAQGLTLEYLVKLANEHMEKLNGRYILKRDDDNELEIEIVDTFQADVIRPTRTLSGGESFLVSLSLALGLSSLSSRKARVDSLFLDEGFGTLDSDMLDVALAALHNLQASGRTIGIISHVEVLKERIPSQIQVIRKSGGISAVRIKDHYHSDL